MKNCALQFCSECCKDSKTVFVFAVARTVSDFYSLEGENVTFYRRSNKSSENVIRVRVFFPFGPVFWGVYSCVSPILFWEMINQHKKTPFLQKNKIKQRLWPIFELFFSKELWSAFKNFFKLFEAMWFWKQLTRSLQQKKKKLKLGTSWKINYLPNNNKTIVCAALNWI